MKHLALDINLEQTGGDCIAVGVLERLNKQAYDGDQASALHDSGDIIDENQGSEIVGDYAIREVV